MSTASLSVARRADPWTDTSVIDARAPRFNQLVVASVSLVAAATGAWPLFGLLALQLVAGLLFGRKYCLPCRIYFELIQPRFGEGPLEDSRAPRFANIVGAVFLAAATLAYPAGFPRAGLALGLTVAALASLAVVTGLCVGCEAYRLIARLRGVKGGAMDRVDLAELGVSASRELVVLFTHPLCHECELVRPRLEADGHRVVAVDVSERPELAARYGVSIVPLAVEVRPDGVVLGVVR
ncbi:MAG: DUF4395 family protein [Sorangiineae bacterium]|nr:DUF4395 family protein [Polyangiaceae bacterium]MEB2325012.1 DUF4395 family protein [Sorangiineae bacterium]